MESSTVPAVDESTGSATIADMMARAAERFGDRPAAKYKRDGTWHDVSFAEVGRDRLRDRARADRPRPGARRPRRRCCAPPAPEWTYADFAITSAGGVVVPIYPTNSPTECAWVAGNSESRFIVCEDAVAGGEDHRGARRAARARGRDRDRRERRRRRRDLARGPARARPRPRRRRGRRARRGRQARGPVHLHLHLGHHRPAEGLRALARQLPRGARHRARSIGALESGEIAYLYLPLAHSYALLIQLLAIDLGSTIAYFGGDTKQIIAELDEVKPDLPPVGAADLREDLHARHLQRRPRADQGRHAARAEGAGAAGRRPGGPGRAPGSSSTRPTRRCSRTSARRSAATSSRPTRARRRSPRRSSSSSTPAACRCSRATA